MNDFALENLNIATDARSCDPAKIPTLIMWCCETCGELEGFCDHEGEMVEVTEQLPWRFEVCGLCRGNGKHVNPAVDAGGLTREDFDADPDFAEDYFSGTYDVTCARCSGKRVEQVIDHDALTKDQATALEVQAKAEAEYRAETLAELRAGC